ncbi:xanthine dehydrogenase/oxidase-like [Lingula anatina]|uniref:Xanthine dehydrogenase/oxidase-like n=1 Tax=Lingula anatina TaxID=7574 RepID=A0A2R2MQ71_LINAN|nr:xanthine dehydrogenase/oxidase-like [Lingula anatina]|eukprot:XP_023932386.1 xanthine dehydrogenase/oxidase-like [Lingula anatina]
MLKTITIFLFGNIFSYEGGQRNATLDNTFYIRRGNWNIKADEIVLSVFIPFSKKNEFVFGYKQAQRRENAAAIVNAGMRVLFEDDTDIIKEMSVAFGGMSETSSLALTTSRGSVGRKWEDQLTLDVVQWLAEDFPSPPEGISGQMPYKRALACSFFFKFFHRVQLELRKGSGMEDATVSPRQTLPSLTRSISRGTQVFEEVPPDQPKHDAVGRPLQHKASLQHATGEAQYCDDMPLVDGELHLALVTSTRAHAKILSIDTSEALALPGVEAFFGHKDVPGSNIRIVLSSGEEIFASEEVTCYGQVIGAIVADTKTHAQRAAKAVKIEYEDLPTVFTIEEAIAKESYYPHEAKALIKSGDTERGFEQADHILEGEIKGGGQEHFYLETHVARVVPRGEDGEIEIFCSTQSPSTAQAIVARALGLPMNRVCIRTKRLGGGFGGKETRYVTLIPVAIAAFKLNRPVRGMLDRDEDMLISGGRHPFLGKYKVGIDSVGRFKALEATVFLNAGNTSDMSPEVVSASLYCFDNCYHIPNIVLTGILCKTNLPSNTAFRGFGAPQSMLVMENIIEDVAVSLNIPSHRGAALVHVYQEDGSVLITHGGVEMGQGLHTKMIQVASRALQVPVHKFHINETTTSSVPNTTVTAASTGSDLNGMAVLNACKTLRRRLEPYIAGNPGGSWEDRVKAAYMDRISLSATGYYKVPDTWDDNYVPVEGQQTTQRYYTYGAACSVVEIDCLTGDHVSVVFIYLLSCNSVTDQASSLKSKKSKYILAFYKYLYITSKVLRTDIVMDVGRSLNPAIDIGQIEGAFAQGYGLFTIEQLRYSSEGRLITNGPNTYKITGYGDIPVEFNVSLLKGASNPKAVYSSKGIGEPPLFLASSVFFAIKDAISSARAESGLKGRFRLDSPATAERIRMACEDQFTRQPYSSLRGLPLLDFIRPNFNCVK